MKKQNNLTQQVVTLGPARDPDQEDRPREKMHVPARFEGSESPKRHLVGFPFRVKTLKTEPANLIGAEAGETALAYAEEQYKIGVHDGYHGIPSELNEANIAATARVEQALGYPMRIKEDIAEGEAVLEDQNSRLSRLRKEVKQLEPKVEEAQRGLDATLQRREQIILENQEKEQATAEAVKPQEGGDAASRARTHRVLDLMTGLMMAGSGLIFVIADIALSVAAIYALGFADVENRFGQLVTWPAAIFNPSTWVTHWEGVFVCLAIAAITMFFKFAYERIFYSSARFNRRQIVVMSVLFAFTMVTLIFLGAIRAQYLMHQAAAAIGGSASDTIFGVPRYMLFWSMFLTTMLFPFLGAMCLTEGLRRLSTATAPVTRAFKTLLSRRARYVDADDEVGLPPSLRRELRRWKHKVQEMEQRRTDLQERIAKTELEQRELEKRLAVWCEALSAYQERWNSIGESEHYLYLQGYEKGRQLRRQKGAFRLMAEKAIDEMTTRRPGSDSTVVKSNGLTRTRLADATETPVNGTTESRDMASPES